MYSNENLLQILHKSGLRLTPQRMAICKAVVQSDRHPTAEAIYEQVRREQPSLSLATVYSVLENLAELGLVSILGLMGDNKVHYDGNLSPHLHLRCTNCHKIVDFNAPAIIKMEEKLQRETGFEVLGNRIVYYGLCPDCQNSHQIQMN